MSKKRKEKNQPKPKLGQHFLFDESTLNKLIDAASVRRSDVVLEIGPGKGPLTQKLALRARKTIAVELDRALAAALAQKMRPYRDVEVVNQDVLKFSIHNFKYNDSYKVIGNIPYYITGKILRKFTATPDKPEVIVLTIQKEVAERVCALSGKMSILACSIQVFGKPEVIAYVPRDKFSPAPEVDSAILRITLYKRSILAHELGWYNRRGYLTKTREEMDKIEKEYFRLVKIGFSSPRKQLHNNLKNGYELSDEEVSSWLARAEIKKESRAEGLKVKEWIRLLETKDEDI